MKISNGVKIIKLKYLVFVLLTCFFIGFRAQAAAGDVLSVAGNKFMLNGAPVLLRGVAMGDPHDRIINYKRVSLKDYEAIKNDWRANVVRLSVHPGVFLNDWPRGKKILEDEAAAARGQGLFVIIDWHVIGQPDGWNKQANVKYYTYDSDFSAAKRFWQYAAEKFKDDRGVIFELWNEPVNEKNDLSWSELRPYLTELTELIRSAGGQNVILAPGVNWGYDLRGVKADPLGGENIAYSWHVYNNNGNVAISREAALGSLNQIYPVFITEWGSNSDKDFGFSVKSGRNVYGYLESVKNLITSLDLSYTAWCWHSAWKPRIFNDGWRSANAYGSLVKDFLKHPEKVRERLKVDGKKKQAPAPTDEFGLRLESYLNNGADASSVKLGEKERRAILDNFAAVFGHQPRNENEWQDLMRINNGYWPSKISQAAEDKAKEDFRKIFKRAPDMNISGDKQVIKILTYDLRQRPGLRSLAKEKIAIVRFKKIFEHLPAGAIDWKFIRALAYGGVKN